MPVVVRRLGRLLILGMSAGCAWSNGGTTVHSGHTPAPTEACVPASWACGAVVRIDARSGAARWQVDTNGDVNSVVADRRGATAQALEPKTGRPSCAVACASACSPVSIARRAASTDPSSAATRRWLSPGVYLMKP